MPSVRRQKTSRRPGSKTSVGKSRPTPKKPARTGKPVPAAKVAKPAARPSAPPKAAAKSSAKSTGATAALPLEIPLPGGRRHVLSLSFVRDGDEFMARLETDSGHITELKNRSLDQLLTLVASELEDLLE